MSQLKIIFKRLKNPSVVTSIVSQIVTILMLVNVDVDHTMVTTLVTAVCGTLTLLGIMSNPDTVTKGYKDDIKLCNNCKSVAPQIKVGKNMVCEECGNVTPILKK